MPSNIVKTFSERTGKSIKEVEELWDKAKVITKEKIPVSSDKFYPTVVGVLKKMLSINEDAVATTTGDIATYAKRLGEPVKRADFDKPDGYHGAIPFYEMKELGDYMDVMKNIKTGQKVSFKDERVKSGVNKYGMAYVKHKTNFPVLVKRNNIYSK